MKSVKIDCSSINDWDSFHSLFQTTMGFPDFYGNNMNAWIDCMTYLDEDDGMSLVKVEKGTVLVLELENSKKLKEQHRDIYDALVECSSFVNYRRIDLGEPAVLALSFHH